MPIKRNLLAVNFVLIGLLVVVFFNNCQPMESAKKSDISNPSLSPPGSSGGQLSAGRTYFENTIKPLINSNCRTCHALFVENPNLLPGERGPVGIFEYADLKARVGNGPTASNNPLLNTMKGAGHGGGGNLCPGDVNGSVSPCLEFAAWISLEFPDLTDGMAGAIVNISPIGVVRGWAFDPKNKNATIPVHVYVNGPVGVGQLVTQVTANESSNDNFSGHYFTVNLPPQYADGTMRSLYIYGNTPVAENLLPAMPHPYIAHTPSQAGRTFYAENVRPFLEACVRCHSGLVNYDQHFLNLVNPKPALGGTALNNELINKMNGENHGGGGFCGGNKANSPCSRVRDWWNVEFQ